MSVSAPSRRLVPQCLFCHSLPIRTRPSTQQRLISQTTRRRADSDGDQQNRSNPILEQYRRDNPEEPASRQQKQQAPKPGDLAASSIFEDDRRAQQQARSADEGDSEMKVGGKPRDPQNMLPVLDPDPNARERWERKKVIQMITRGGRLSKKEVIKRTEREHLVKSHMLKTSIKKLGMLARQIQGKKIDDAITQMRFSKKKIAQEVLKQLEFARDEAVVSRGMGLANISPPNSNQTSLLTTSGSSSTAERESGKPIQIQLKDGKRHAVADKSAIYIDQAWVGRGPYGKLPDYRARGRIYVMRTPWTSISLLLKEESTRVREYEEREAKRLKKRQERVWVPLPDRPVNGAGHGRGWFAW